MAHTHTHIHTLADKKFTLCLESGAKVKQYQSKYTFLLWGASALS